MTGTATVQTVGSEAVVDQGQVDIPSEIKMATTREELQQKIEEISSNKLKDLLTREAKIHNEIEELSSIDAERNERRITALQSDLATLRAEIAKRGEDLASLSYAIAGEMEVFGRLSGEALEDTEEDIAKKQSAYDTIEFAEQGVIDAKSRLGSLETELTGLETAKTNAEGSFFIGRKGRVEKANADLRRHKNQIKTAQNDVEIAEQDLEKAKENLPVILEQVEVDKRNRIREASLEETYATISRWVAQAKKVLKDDITEYLERITETQSAKDIAIKRRVKAAERIKTAKDDLETLEIDFDTLKLQRDDISDKTSTDYQKLTAQMEDLTVRLDAAKNEQKLAESGFTDAEIAVKERIQSLRSLTAQCELAKVQFNKFVTNEETAHYIGQNIEVLVKGSTRETLNESLDRGVHKMTVAVYDVSKKAEVASTKQLTDMKRRKLDVLELMEEMDGETDQALAAEQERYADLVEKMREGFERQGLDVEEMSNLNAAAKLVKDITGNEQTSGAVESEMF